MYFAHPFELFCLTNFGEKKYEFIGYGFSFGTIPGVDSYSRCFGTINYREIFFIFVSTCILERVFSHLEGMCSDCK